MARTHTFKGSSNDYGYSAYIEDGQLVLEYWDPRSGGVYFRGSLAEAFATKVRELAEIKKYNVRLYNDIEKYYLEHKAEDEIDKLKKKYSFDEETKTILFKVKLHKKNGVVHNVLVRGRFQADVIKKLMPQIPEVLTLQTPSADVFAIRSDEISAVEFVESFSAGVTISKAVGIK